MNWLNKVIRVRPEDDTEVLRFFRTEYGREYRNLQHHGVRVTPELAKEVIKNARRA